MVRGKQTIPWMERSNTSNDFRLVNFIYKLDNVELEHVSKEKDVGVNITNSLSWNTHIHAITARANKLLGLLKRTCPLLDDVSVRRSLYLALVKSQLSYATQVWSPDKIVLKAQTERVFEDPQGGSSNNV